MNTNTIAPPDPAFAIRPDPPAGRDPSNLDSILTDQSLAAGADRRGERATRADGWTPDRIRTFLLTLADCGVVTDAAAAAGISVRSAYNLRNRAEGRAFHYAWEAALQIAKRRLADAVMSRAMHGCVDQIRRDGQVVAERVRFDNRLSMAILTRLDQRVKAADAEAGAVRAVVAEFDQFVGIASSGGAGASEFIAARREEEAGPEDILERLDNFARYQVGLPEEIDTFDLNSEQRDRWTAEQFERARRAGVLDRLAEEAAAGEWRAGAPAFDGSVPEYGPGGEMRWAMSGGGHLSFQAPQPPPPTADGNDELREL